MMEVLYQNFLISCVVGEVCRYFDSSCWSSWETFALFTSKKESGTHGCESKPEKMWCLRFLTCLCYGLVFETLVVYMSSFALQLEVQTKIATGGSSSWDHATWTHPARKSKRSHVWQHTLGSMCFCLHSFPLYNSMVLAAYFPHPHLAKPLSPIAQSFLS